MGSLVDLAEEIISLMHNHEVSKPRLSQHETEIKIKGVVARIFRLGMGAGWDKAMAVVEEMYPGTQDGTRK